MENMLLYVVEEKYCMNKINYVWQKKSVIIKWR